MVSKHDLHVYITSNKFYGGGSKNIFFFWGGGIGFYNVTMTFHIAPLKINS